MSNPREWTCAVCRERASSRKGAVLNRYSFGAYAGRYHDKCWLKSWFRDAVDPSARFDPMDAGEEMDPEPYYGMSAEDWS